MTVRVIDIETTGIDPATDAIVAVASGCFNSARSSAAGVEFIEPGNGKGAGVRTKRDALSHHANRHID